MSLVTLKWLQIESFLFRVGECRKAVIPWERRGRSAEKNLSISFEKHVSSRLFRTAPVSLTTRYVVGDSDRRAVADNDQTPRLQGEPLLDVAPPPF